MPQPQGTLYQCYFSSQMQQLGHNIIVSLSAFQRALDIIDVTFFWFVLVSQKGCHIVMRKHYNH